MKSYMTIAGAIMLGNQVSCLGTYYPHRMEPFVEEASIQIGGISTKGKGTNVITGNGNTINTHHKLQVESALNYEPMGQYTI